MKEKNYYSITTRKFTLRCGHPEWLKTTQDFYNRIVLFYYNLYLDQWESSQWEELLGQQALRKLERLSIVGRDKQPVPYPLPWDRVPLYFRRSAANKGIAAGRSYVARKLQVSEEIQGLIDKGQQGACISKQLSRSKYFQEPVTYYKGMYKELTEHSVELKVWNGQEWRFIHCRISANFIPEGGICLSPSVLLREKEMYLNVPVSTSVRDGRKARERLGDGARICVVQFAAGDIFAVGLVGNGTGKQLGVHFFRGGKEYTHRCTQVLKRIERSEQERKGNTQDRESKSTESGNEEKLQENKRYWNKIKNLNDFYSNKISRQVINYCNQYDVEIIVMPKYEDTYNRYIMCAAGNFSATHLSNHIRQQIQYKAWQFGILVLEAAPYNCGRICSICGSAIKRKGAEYICENGHRGNRYLNSARNMFSFFIRNRD